MTELPWLLGNQWVFGLIVAAALLAIAEVGYRVGLRLFTQDDQARRSQIGGVQGAVLGLLGLLLGFTFSMAVTRFETRRDMVLKEANAIGTTWLRAGLLPEPQKVESRKLLRRFVDTRVEYQKKSYDPVMLAEGLRLSSEIENSLWDLAEVAAKEAPSPTTVAYIGSLNEMIDTDAERIAAHRNRIPGAVWALLLFVSACGCLISTYGSGAEGVRSAFTSFLLPVMIAVVILFIYDLLDTHQGVVSISQEPLLDLQKSMEGK